MVCHPENPLPHIHRYITTHSTDGEAVFVSHAQVPDYMPSTPAGTDGEIALLYSTTSTPANTSDESDIAMYDEFLHQPPGITVENGTVFRMIDLRPGKVTPMHRTVSLDYGIVVEGCVDLVLDSGETRRLGRGDVCVQRGTAHSFRNVDRERWSRMLFVFLPMRRVVVKGRELEAEVYDEGFDKDDGDGEGKGDEGGGGDADRYGDEG
jgi:quercetin dioxygenase-like cupin family protein